jgi:AraC-like DNA-binding protein
MYKKMTPTHDHKPAIHEITPLSDRDCFYVVERFKNEFTYPLHSHEAYELNFIEKAEGVRRIVGDSTEIIGPYDLVLITGHDLEHTWEQHHCHSDQIREITIQFSPGLLGDALLHKTQFDRIREMFEKARHGLCFPMNAIMRVYNMLDTIAAGEQGFEAFLRFLTLLHTLAGYAPEARTLSSSAFAQVEPTCDSRRVKRVQNYIAQHFAEKVRLEDVAEMVGMTTTSFSRFFKLRTGSPFSEYLIDVRIGHAARSLIDSTMSVSEICYQCGFNNLSNFNRLFKQKKGYSPTEFRSFYQKKKILV